MIEKEDVLKCLKSLFWLKNQIPFNSLTDTNEDRMLKCIYLYVSRAIVVIENLDKRRDYLESKLSSFNDTLSQCENGYNAEISLLAYELNTLKSDFDLLKKSNEYLTRELKSRL